MADYKKKSVKKQSKAEPRNYPMTNSKKRQQQIFEKPKFKIRKGKKGELKLSLFISVALLIVIASIYFIILAFHPIGVSEFFSSKFKSAGKGEGYTIELKGEDILSSVRAHDYYFTLTESEVLCNNNNGKQISTIEHGFARPILYAAETRYIIFGQGEQTVKVYNFDEELHNIHYDATVLGAAIADNGNFAVARTADGYDSMITVYNKNAKVLYEWYSSSGIVSSTKFIAGGKKLLVTTFSASDGEFSSKTIVLNFKAADAEQTFKFDGELCYNIYSVSKDTVAAVFEDSVKFLNFRDGSVVTKSYEYSVKLTECEGGYTLVSGNLDSNIDKNHITLYNKRLETVSDFVVDFSVKSAIYEGKCIYLLSDNFLNCYNLKGELIYTSAVTLDVKCFVPLDEKSFAAVSNNFITKIQFEKAE